MMLHHTEPPVVGDEVAYALYDGERSGPTVVCVQWFDMYDYDENRWLSTETWTRELDADNALVDFLERHCTCGPCPLHR